MIDSDENEKNERTCRSLRQHHVFSEWTAFHSASVWNFRILRKKKGTEGIKSFVAQTT